MNAEPKEARKRPRLIWLLLVDLIATYMPWALYLAVIARLVGPSRLMEPSIWKSMFFPIQSLAWWFGIQFDAPTGTGPIVLWTFIFAFYFAILIVLQHMFYRWFKYLVPAHLFLSSAIPVGNLLWPVFYYW